MELKISGHQGVEPEFWFRYIQKAEWKKVCLIYIVITDDNFVFCFRWKLTYTLLCIGFFIIFNLVIKLCRFL